MQTALAQTLEDSKLEYQLYTLVPHIQKLKAVRDVPGLIGELEKSNGGRPIDLATRMAAIRALGLLEDAIAVDALIAALSYKGGDYQQGTVRGLAVQALGKLGDRRAAEALIPMLQDKDASVRASTADALGKLGDRGAAEALIPLLQDKDASVCASAADALGKLGDVRAVEPLIAMLRSTNNLIRVAAITALGALDDKRAIEPLVPSLLDKASEVRFAAGTALQRLGIPAGAEQEVRAAIAPSCALCDAPSPTRTFDHLIIEKTQTSRGANVTVSHENRYTYKNVAICETCVERKSKGKRILILASLALSVVVVVLYVFWNESWGDAAFKVIGSIFFVIFAIGIHYVFGQDTDKKVRAWWARYGPTGT